MKIKAAFAFFTFLVVGLFLSSPATSLAGDLHIVQEIRSSGVMGQPPTTTTQEVWMSGNALRTDDAENNASMIMRLDKKVMWMISHEDKTYFEMDLEMFQDMTKTAMSMFGKQGEGEATVEKTGATKKIGEWNCYEVKISAPIMGGMEINSWYTEDIKADRDLFITYLETLGMGKMFGGLFEKMKDINGIPVESRSKMSFMGMNMESYEKLLKYDTDDIEKARFEKPKGYKETNSPPAGTMGGGAALGQQGR